MMEPRVLQHDEKGDGDPIVLVPGGLTGWLSWIPHQERLAATRRTIRVQPVHNELGSRGELIDADYDDEVERECLRVTLDELGIGATDFAAWSGGARAMIEFSLTYPERIRSLTLIEPPALWAIRGSSPEAVIPPTRVKRSHAANCSGMGEQEVGPRAESFETGRSTERSRSLRRSTNAPGPDLTHRVVRVG
jgi:pimeloyl-ACP methyl ester carboxylesterase